jgi:hypothetical protein
LEIVCGIAFWLDGFCVLVCGGVFENPGFQGELKG